VENIALSNLYIGLGRYKDLYKGGNGMGLYKVTYKFKWLNPVRTEEASQYILAPNFQTAAKLAETSKEITSRSVSLFNCRHID
jgi:hypothetical protein